MRLGLTLAVVLLSAAAFAQDVAVVDCANTSVQSELTNCAYQEYERSDAELNRIWKDAKATAEADDEIAPDDGLSGAEALLKSQRGWIDYRDGTCMLYGFEARGGSMEPMLVSMCLTRVTNERIKELQGYIKSNAN